ncbi:MAG: tetratricopeptide repeat-containing sensor histidine kinase [Ferruginibacter sp.]|nr:tetratricopeptide repeat-containing sensor histidine kinase [Ferruginibacter sp.]
MHKAFIVCCILFFNSFLQAQTSSVDSLLKSLDREKTDTGRMKLYNSIGNFYMDNNAGKAIDYLRQARTLAQKLRLPLKVANNNYSIGFCYLMKGDFDESLAHYLESVKGYEQLNDSFRLANAFMSIGNLYTQNKDFARTAIYYDRARTIIELQKDTLQLINILAQTGILMDQQLKFDSALQYLQEALRYSRRLGDADMETNTLSNIGLTYKHQKNTEKAIAYFDSVLVAYKTMDVPTDNVAAIYNNIGATHSQAGNFAAARVAFDKSVALAKSAGSPFIEMENYNNLSDMFGREKNFALQAAYLKKYYDIKDSLFTADNKNQLTQLEADYQVEKKNAELIKKDVEVSSQKNQRNLSLLVALSAAIVLLILIFFFRKTRKNNLLLNEKNQQINHQNVELETLNGVKDRLFGVISHDLRNPLVTLRSYLSLTDDPALQEETKKQFKESTLQAVAQTSDMLDNLLVWANMQIKSTTPSLQPVQVDEIIEDALGAVRVQAEQKRVVLHQQVAATTVLGENTILTIAVRNILTNAIKFSQSGGNIFIEVSKEKDTVLLSIKDQGVGMSPEQLEQLNANQAETTAGTTGEKGSGLGIFLVKELLAKINAKLTITSEPGLGTTATMEFDAL